MLPLLAVYIEMYSMTYNSTTIKQILNFVYYALNKIKVFSVLPERLVYIHVGKSIIVKLYKHDTTSQP